MDRETRNRIQRATQAARELLEHEYAEQLEGVFDIRLDGTIATEPGEHLDAPHRVLRRKLVTAVEHQRTSGMSKADAVTSYLREAAFTTLNRFVALKMLEARDLVQECISRGDQSAGFKEFTGLAPGLVQHPDHGYRVYIESLFDEIGREVRVLFDRRDPASLLWPRRQGLIDLLGILNASELAPVWGEDETIGWVYQYFNSDDERKQMRAESQAPRNSRELAVRNQFFTPRYVVQFLTDNTLGRIWYEMRKGETRLGSLEYLARPPHEAFLGEGDEPPTDPNSSDNDAIQGTLEERPTYVEYRPKKDPRDLRILDPACGSGHFLLYTFDLLLEIYEEAWADGDSPAFETTAQTLREDFPELKALKAAAPGLILRHNLHGIDIDARCAQIAALALWMRAQRAFKDLGISRAARPPIQKTNIVVAEPMPGDAELRREFAATLEPKLRQLVERVFGRMDLAGEAGSLLRIEDDIRDAVQEIHGGHGELFEASDEELWREAEEDVLQALQAYSESAANVRSYQRRLFAEDAARGLGFIDLCGQKYQVVLMNPPFGTPSTAVLQAFEGHYIGIRHDLATAFLDRARALAANDNIGAITTRTPFFLSYLSAWRERFLYREPTWAVFADFGVGVLDALVETAAYCLHKGDGESTFIRLLGEPNKSESLRRGVSSTCDHKCSRRRLDELAAFPKGALAYWAPRGVAQAFASMSPTRGQDREIYIGAATLDDFRFTRLRWEVPTEAEPDCSRVWVPYSNGGSYNPFVASCATVLNWASDGHELKAFVADYRARKGFSPHWTAVLNSSEQYFRPGITFSRRPHGMGSFWALPDNAIFGNTGVAMFDRPELMPADLAVLNSTTYAGMVSYLMPRGTEGANTTLKYELGYVASTPFPNIPEAAGRRLTALAERAIDLVLHALSTNEVSEFFGLGRRDGGQWPPLVHSLLGHRALIARLADAFTQVLRDIDELVVEQYSRCFEGDFAEPQFIGASMRGDLKHAALTPPDDKDVTWRLLSLSVGVLFGRWSTPSDSCVPRWLGRGIEGRYEQSLADSGLSEPAEVDVLVTDAGHDDDLATRVRAVLIHLGVSAHDADGTLRGIHSLFDWHLGLYSAVKRKAPIYWQLATPTASYSVWLYYHRLTPDTLYRLLHDYATPKQQHEERKLTSLTQGVGPKVSASQRKEIDAQERFVAELRAFHEELARVAPLWNPDLNDGVIINFAPLWRLVPHHRAWQKDCKKVWDKLVKGDYDWAHLAMHLWPERVVPKCAKDRSLAIAHGLEDAFWCEDSDGKWQPRKVAESDVAKLVKERTSAAVKDALKSLLEAPAPATGRAMKKKAPRAKGTRKRTTSARSKAATNGASSSGRSPVAIDAELLSKVKDAIGSNGDGASKADVIDATGISASEWNKAVKALLADGSVTQTGERRGARYHLGGGDA